MLAFLQAQAQEGVGGGNAGAAPLAGANAVSGLMSRLTEWLGLGEYPWVAGLLGGALVLLVAYLAYAVTMRYLLRLVERLIRRSQVRWDDALLERKVLRRAAMLAPVLVIFYGIQFIPHVPETVEVLVQRGGVALIALVVSLALSALLTALNDIYARSPMAQSRPIKGYLQIVQIFLFVIAGVLMVAVLLDRSPWAFVTGIGAMTAVLLLIFRDTILSFVASIQMATNDMVRIGDWIEVPQYGADGDVIDIALHTIKVQNWDKTISTIPTYKLIDGSFKNWRGMTEAGGRRIKRSLSIDMTSVQFLTEEEVERFGKFALLADYVAAKRREIAEHNRQHARGPEVTDAARRLTNFGTFRAYVAAYLRQHPGIFSERMTFLVRQLAPGPEGMPLEIYVFAKSTAWAEYEGIQADVFDHLLAILPEFGLRVFQKPTGADLAGWSGVGTGGAEGTA